MSKMEDHLWVSLFLFWNPIKFRAGLQHDQDCPHVEKPKISLIQRKNFFKSDLAHFYNHLFLFPLHFVCHDITIWHWDSLSLWIIFFASSRPFGSFCVFGGLVCKAFFGLSYMRAWNTGGLLWGHYTVGRRNGDHPLREFAHTSRFQKKASNNVTESE